MATASLSTFLKRLTRGMVAETLNDQTDRRLVEQFLARRDEAAFEGIVRRHGAMVYRVCWRVLRQTQDTEDAFQAAFLLLAQKLRTLRNHDSLASWLHGVAHRVALQVKGRSVVRHYHEQRATMSQVERSGDLSARELLAVVDAEVGKLPDKWRLPLILFYLEGRTQEEAARQLGCSRSTLIRRLDEARTALGRRLTARGVVWSAALTAVLLSDSLTSAALPSGLIGSTVETASAVAAGRAVTAGAISAKVAALMEGVTKAMVLSQCKTATTVLVVALGFLVSGAVVYYQAAAGQEGTPIAQRRATDEKKKVPEGRGALPSGVPDWFQKLDADNDRQISLYEWRCAGKSAEDFGHWDLNDDGFITLDEAVAVARELKKMVGTWHVVSLVVNGDNLLAKNDIKSRSAVIKDNTLIVVGGENGTQAALKVNPSKEPREIDIIFTAGPNKGETLRGLYKQEGNYLTLCYAGGDVGRPTDFSSQHGSGRSLIVYKRQTMRVSVKPEQTP